MTKVDENKEIIKKLDKKYDAIAIECQCLTSAEHSQLYEIIDKLSYDRPILGHSLELWANRHWCYIKAKK